MSINNPLKQYFRRPALYIKLNNHLYDETAVQQTPTGEFPVYPMTAIDEITTRTPDAVLNGTAVVDIIKSCMPNILDPWKLIAEDIDTVLIAIRIASNGEKMELSSKCPSCKEEFNFDMNLISILNTRRKSNYDETLNIRELVFKFRPLTYIETNNNGLIQYELQKTMYMLDQMEDSDEKTKQQQDIVNKLKSQLNTIIASTIEYIQTPETRVYEKQFISEFLVNCEKNTSQTIQEHSIKIKSASELPPCRLKCINCSNEYEQAMVLNVTDFFA
jgi:hypothetical protein